MVSARTSSWCAAMAFTIFADSPYLRAISPPMIACDPSTSWVSALPMSCSSAARRACFSLSPSSAAIAPDEGGLDRVHEHVLRVAVAVLEHADQLDQLGMDAVHPDLEHGALTGLADRVVELLLCLAHHLLDPTRMNAPIGDEALERQARQLAPDGVVARDHDDLRRVIDDEVHPGRRLDGPDVSPLAADDAPLHVVAGERDDRDGALGDELPRQALDGDRDDLLGGAIGLLARLPLDLPDVPGRVVAGLILHLLDEGLLGLVARHAGGLLEFLPDRVDESIVLHPASLERLVDAVRQK